MPEPPTFQAIADAIRRDLRRRTVRRPPKVTAQALIEDLAYEIHKALQADMTREEIAEVMNAYLPARKRIAATSFAVYWRKTRREIGLPPLGPGRPPKRVERPKPVEQRDPVERQERVARPKRVAADQPPRPGDQTSSFREDPEDL